MVQGGQGGTLIVVTDMSNVACIICIGLLTQIFTGLISRKLVWI